MHIPADVQIEHRGTSVIVRFPGPRAVLSTSWLNGGYRTDLSAVFNHQISLEACEACHHGENVQMYLGSVARDLGLDPAAVTGLVTRAEMKNTAVISETFRDLTVIAIVTAGIDKNGGRAGDPASYYESSESFEPVGGTVNTILIIGAALPEYAMSRALMTATEAKAVALQQLMARSIYSAGIATGSGTDMIAVVADTGSSLVLTDAGKHAKLGELIGRTVIRATTLALERETGLSPESQRDVLVRLSRFGISGADLFHAAAGAEYPASSGCFQEERFMQFLKTWSKDPGHVALTAAALHLLDEAAWGLLPLSTVQKTIDRIFQESEDDRSVSGTESDGCFAARLSRLVTRDLMNHEGRKRGGNGSGKNHPD